MKPEQLQNIFEQSYSREIWTEVLREVFGANNLYITPQRLDIGNNPWDSEGFELGNLETEEGYLVGIYQVDINEKVQIERNKVGLRSLLRPIYKNDVDAALIVFNQGNKWRFSYISEITVRNQKTGQREERKTDPKRFTYVFGEGKKNRTAAERFSKIQLQNSLFGGKINLKDIEEAFSVEKLTKDFYEELSNWYFWAVEKIDFPGGPERGDFDSQCAYEEKRNAYRSTHVIRLITRLMFVWFIKQKGLIPDELFDKNVLDEILDYKDKTGSTYYKAILQNLFFASLNAEMKGDNRQFVRRQTGQQEYYRYARFFKDKTRFLELTKNVPFLNGGLFENLDKNPGEADEVRIDCFSNRGDNEEKLTVPDTLFFTGDEQVDLDAVYGDHKHNKLKIKGLISILKSYNFTIEENTPLEIEVALDPELLGKVFENLLASYNPETKTTARKLTGSFYTPREIVEYMVDESLKAYLKQALTDASAIDTRLNDLFSYSESPNPFDPRETEILINAINKCKVLDPACGSGAFPMGVLQKLIHVLDKLDPENKQWFELVIANFPTEMRETVRKKLAKENWNYVRKLGIIKECIYGVDIQPIAIQISKLRFFISLLVDQKEQPNEPNRGFEPLPNLDFKIVASNTLIHAPEADECTFGLFSEFTDPFFKEFDELTAQYFNLHDKSEKKKIKSRIIKLIEEKIEEKNKALKRAQQISDKKQETIVTRNIELWSSYRNLFNQDTVGFFEPRYFFPRVDHFDIIIGNPPFVQLQKDKGALALLYKDQKYETFERTGDIYALFYEQGYNLLNDNGIQAFISSNQWMQTSYGKSLRNFFLKKNPLFLVNLGPGVFESATVDTSILIGQNCDFKNVLKGITIKDRKDLVNRDSLHFLPMPGIKQGNWKVLNAVQRRIEEALFNKGRALSDWDIQINRGILTGYNEAFVIDETKRNELIQQDSKNDEILKPILRGRNVEKYYTEWEGSYLINTHNGSKKENILPIDIDQYPIIKDYLNTFFDSLTSRTDKGNTPYNLRNCAYMREFQKEKIIWKRIGSQLRFTYCDEELYSLDSTCIATGEKMKYLTALLNSKLCAYQLSQTAPRTGMGDLIISVQALEPLLVYYPEQHEEEIVETLVDYVFELKQRKTAENIMMCNYFERVIDAVIYEFYFDRETTENDCCILKHLDCLPDIQSKTKTERIELIHDVFNELNDNVHPVRNALFKMDTIPVIAAIEDKPYIHVSTGSLQFSAQGGIQNAEISSNTDWTIEIGFSEDQVIK